MSEASVNSLTRNLRSRLLAAFVFMITAILFSTVTQRTALADDGNGGHHAISQQHDHGQTAVQQNAGTQQQPATVATTPASTNDAHAANAGNAHHATNQKCQQHHGMDAISEHSPTKVHLLSMTVTTNELHDAAQKQRESQQAMQRTAAGDTANMSYLESAGPATNTQFQPDAEPVIECGARSSPCGDSSHSYICCPDSKYCCFTPGLGYGQGGGGYYSCKSSC